MNDHWERVFAVYKARFTLGLAFLAAFLSLVGYGVTKDRPFLLLVAAAVPILALVIDCILIWVLAAPVLYVGLIHASQQDGKESALKLLLAYSAKRRMKMEEIMALEDASQRQMKFRRFLLYRGLKVTGLIMGAAALLTILGWWWLTH